MFRELEGVTAGGAGYVLLDDAGEKVYANNLTNEYNALLTSNHLYLALREFKRSFQKCQLSFENIQIVVYDIDDCYLFFFNDKLVDSRIMNQYEQIADITKRIVSS